MNGSRWRRGAGTLVATVVVLGALVVTVQELDGGSLLAAASSADPGLLAAAAVLYAVSWPLRGRRYRDVLAAMDRPLSTRFLTLATFASQTANLALPARAGDGVRAVLLKREQSVPYPTGAASLAVERAFDLVTVTGLAVAGVLALASTGTVDPAALLTAEQGAGPAIRAAGVVGGGAVVGAVGLIVVGRHAEPALPSVEGGRLGRITDAVRRFWADLVVVVGRPRTLAVVGGGSLLIWVLDVGTAVLVLAALAPDVGTALLLVGATLAVSVGNLAKVLPLTQGGIGLYETAFVALLVTVTPVGPSVALAAAVLDHALKNAVTLAGGLIAVGSLNVSLRAAEQEGTRAGRVESRDSPMPEAD